MGVPQGRHSSKRREETIAGEDLEGENNIQNNTGPGTHS